MSILINSDSRVVIQGITGKEGIFHTERMLAYGTKIVAGVTPGKGKQEIFGIPVFDTVIEAVNATDIDVSLILVPAFMAADAICEASAAGIKLIVVITEYIPVFDMLRAKAFLKTRGTYLVGPNSPGIISPGQCKVGIMPSHIHKRGKVGIISRSGTLTYEVVLQLSKIGIGQSTCVGIGGDPIIGLNFVDLLEKFLDDSETEVVCIIGEIGGDNEERAADFIITNRYPKPVFGFIAGLTAPSEKRMGHAGAIISGYKGRGVDKVIAMEKANIYVIKDISQFGLQVAKFFK